jgi:hypothetical protein
MPQQNKQSAKSELTFGDRLVGKGLELYGKMVDREALPLNKRMLLESVVDLRKDPITAESMRPAEREGLLKVIRSKYKPIEQDLNRMEKYLSEALASHRRAVASKNKDKSMYPEFVAQFTKDLNAIRQFKKGVITPEFISLTSGNENSYERNYVHEKLGIPYFKVAPRLAYEDYGVPSEEARNIYAEDLPSIFHTTFGRVNYNVDPKTKALVIQEDYDFNPYQRGVTGQQMTTPNAEGLLSEAPDIGPQAIYNAIRSYAGKVLPPGQGRQINVQLNQLAPPPQNALITR